MIMQVKCFYDTILGCLEDDVNKWLEENIKYVTIRDIKLQIKESARVYVAMILYEKDTAEEFIDKMVKGELE